MRLRPVSRADRLVGRLPRLTVYSAAELLLLALIAVQGARLVWTLVTPVGPIGDYRNPVALAPGGTAALTEFDPFFRLSGSGPAVVTALSLRLYGVREDRATGRGSAIIALPDGTQRSFGVGEEIMPGVTLAEVGFDNVTIHRNGAPEQIFLDQSESDPAASSAPVPPAGAAPAPVRTAPTAPQVVVSPASPPIRFQPRMSEGQVDGIIVSPGGDGGQAFRAAGFAPGDVIISINGERVGSTEQARALIRGANGPATVIVDRDGRQVPIVLRLNL